MFLTQRGKLTTTRTVKSLSSDERKRILEDLLIMGSKKTKEKWNISKQTLAHLKFFNKNLIEQIEDEHFKKFNL